MRVLTVDVGNTSVDVCLFEKELTYTGKFSLEELPFLEADKVLVSSVRPSKNAYIKEKYPEARFIGPEEVPIDTAFKGKEKVGVDRLLNLYGAVSFFGKDIVLVSAGTALVVDLAIEGVFQGGFITLGIGSGLSCLHQKAELIPKIELKDLQVRIGTNTQEAVLGGFIKQAMYFVKGCVESWQEAYRKDLKVVITGGDGWLLKSLGLYEPLLLHRALLFLSENTPL